MSAAKNRALVIGLTALASLSMIVAFATAIEATYQNRVLPRTIVAGINLSGQTPEVAEQVLAQKANQLERTPIKLALNDSEQTITPNDLGVALQTDNVTQTLFAPLKPFSWLRPSYWRHFFARKSLPLNYQLSDGQLQETVDKKLSVSSAPKDAQIGVENGNLTVIASQPGLTIDLDQLKNDLNRFFATGVVPKIVLTAATQVPPSITTNQAEVVKTQIEQSLHSVTLITDIHRFVLSPADQYGLIEYSVNGTELNWQVSRDKLKTYLQDKVAAKINFKMVQEQLEKETNRVLRGGVDGKQVDLAALEPNVYQAITGQNPNPEPIPIPIKTIAFSSAHVEPGYIANLFPGLYVDVNLKKQRMYIMDGPNVTQEFLISSGLPGLPTPEGQFYTMNKISLARSPLYPDLWMPKWNALTTSADGSRSGYKGYGVHALPCFDRECQRIEGEAHLGKAVSHGCVRLGQTDAAWFYDNIPVGTPVHIHK